MDIRSLIQRAKEVCKRTSEKIYRGAARLAGCAIKFTRVHKVATIAVSACTIMVMLMSMVLIKRRNVVIYIDDVETASFSTLKQQPEEWLELAKVEIYDGDAVSVEKSTVRVERAFYVTVKADGVETAFKTLSCTVSDAVANAEVILGDADIVSPSLDTVLEGDTVIEISRVSTGTVTETEIIEYETERVETDKLYKGETEVKTKGENGKTEYTYAVTYVDGEETDRTLVSKQVVKQAVNKVVLVGTKKKPEVTTASTPSSYKAVYTMKASAYTYGDDGGNHTATGIRPYKGVVAVDPSVIPLGTKLYIEASDGSYIYGEAVAADTGGSIKGNRIDLFLNSERECSRFGRRTVNVYVLS